MLIKQMVRSSAVDNPADFPEPVTIQDVEEPFVKAQIMVPNDFVGAVMELSQRKRGEFITMDYLDDYRVNVVYNIPLSEIVLTDKIRNQQHKRLCLIGL